VSLWRNQTEGAEIDTSNFVGRNYSDLTQRPRQKVRLKTTRARWGGFLFLALSGAVSLGFALRMTAHGGTTDFNAVYYGARCLIQNRDPYNENEILKLYQADGGGFPSDPTDSRMARQSLLLCINLPTGLSLIAPFAMLPLGLAQVVWKAMTAAGLILAACLMWDLAAIRASGVSLFLISILLANSEIALSSGNTAGIVVSLCIIAVWCFLSDRFVLAGALCLAVSLAIKPHDAGLVWLYFLLAGGVRRTRALQTIALTIAITIAGTLWVSHVSPNWIQELHTNLIVTSAHGGMNDPGPSSWSSHGVEMVISLQAAISVFRDDPRIYNLGTYLICGAMLLAWSLRTLRFQFSQPRAFIALAAVSALTLLVTYHRPYDAKLLLLTLPAGAVLWSEGGPTGWISLLVNTAGIVITADIPLAFFLSVTRNLRTEHVGLLGNVLTLLLIRPISVVLLAMAVFYLWVYMQRGSTIDADSLLTLPESAPIVPITPV
jgi:Glycosyltransferase family 87